MRRQGSQMQDKTNKQLTFPRHHERDDHARILTEAAVCLSTMNASDRTKGQGMNYRNHDMLTHLYVADVQLAQKLGRRNKGRENRGRD